jgi:hypothetical protein
MNRGSNWTFGQTLECADSFVRHPKPYRLTQKSARIHALSRFTFQYSSLAQRILGFENSEANQVSK